MTKKTEINRKLTASKIKIDDIHKRIGVLLEGHLAYCQGTNVRATLENNTVEYIGSATTARIPGSSASYTSTSIRRTTRGAVYHG